MLSFCGGGGSSRPRRRATEAEEFRTPIKERGVLEAVTVYRNEDGQ
ncbi:hypothetical protein [Nocardioides immobilis]|nr:hypothetical protein [Nocardioides immobilis]